MNTLRMFVRHVLITKVLALCAVCAFAQTPTSTSLAISPNPVILDETFIATVTVSGNNPSGRVCVNYDWSATSKSCKYLLAGQATFYSPWYATADLGAHTAFATYQGDNANAVSTSASVAYTVVNSNAPPTVSFTHPANSATFVAPASVVLEASASDADGTVAKVEFFNGQTLLATVTQAPYQYTWTGVTPGTYQLTARATDNLGAVTPSAAVNVTVATNQAPTVSLTATPSNATAPASIALNAVASDADGSIAKVEFFNGQALLAMVTQAPYQYNWTDVTPGAYQLTAVATDNLGAVAGSAAIDVTVTASQGPSVTITATPSTATAPATIALDAVASGTGGPIAKVEFFNGENLLGTTAVAPYTYTWANVAKGTYLVMARATYDGGGTANSPAVFVRVADAGSGPGEPGAAQVYYVYPDHLNTPRLITDQSNNPVWKWDGELFGADVPNQDPANSGTAFAFNLRFPGQYFDKETNLHYNYVRDYDPSTGRYIQSDPIGLRGGINTYAYVGGNPLSKVDPLGLAGGPPISGVYYGNGSIPVRPQMATNSGPAGLWNDFSNAPNRSEVLPGDYIGVNYPWAMPPMTSECVAGYYGPTPNLSTPTEDSGNSCRPAGKPPVNPNEGRTFTCTQWQIVAQ